MDIELVNIDDLDLDSRNARKHDAKNLKAIADSLQQFGQRKPIVVWGKTVVAGNGTMAAARSLGWTEIEIVRVPDDWSSDQVKAYALADNRSAELAAWDEQVLASQLLELQEAEFDIQLLGFELPVDELQEVVEDEIPEQVEPKSKLGDVWQLGKHRLLCGDSTNEQNVAKLMQDKKANLIWTDPPYGMSYKNTWTAPKKFDVIENDELVGADLIALVQDALSLILKYAKDSPMYICLTWKTYSEFASVMNNLNRKIQSCIVWDKQSIGLGNTDYRPQHEFIFYSSGNWFGDRATPDVWQIARARTSEYSHPTQKPLELVVKAIENSSNRKDNVVDVFGGSGSTLIACEQTDRTCFMMELDPKYVDVIIARWEKLTGQTAELIEG
jgi:site-specific DNA-methyltransferase (adenine-specific)